MVAIPPRKKATSLSNPISKIPGQPTWATVSTVFGSVLLLAGLVDLLIKAYPFKLLNPYWDLQLISAISEMMPIYLLGALILCAPLLISSHSSNQILRKVAGWSSMAIAVFLVALNPLMITDSVRISNIATAQLGAQQKQALEQLSQAQRAVSNLESPDDLKRLNLKLRNSTPEGVASFREAANKDLIRKRQELIKSVKAKQETLGRRQMRNSIRAGVGLILGATCFATLGRSLQQRN